MYVIVQWFEAQLNHNKETPNKLLNRTEPGQTEKPPVAEGDGVLRPHGIHRGGTLTETAVKEDTIAVMNVVETL